MKRYSLSHVANHTLLSKLATLNTQDHGTTAELLACIGEVDDRKLYLPAGYSSMYLYCVHELHMSEDTAYKRIRVARIARQFPAIFEAVADGRLGLSAVLLLTPKLFADTVDDLLAAATHKTNAEIERLLAERFPQPDLPTLIEALEPATGSQELAVRPVEARAPEPAVRPVGPTVEAGPMQAQLPARTRIAPRAPDRFALQVTLDQETHDQLRYAQALLGHAVQSSDVAAVLKRALDTLVEKLERQKFAKCARSRPPGGLPKGRYVPAEVRRSVWQRDQGRCTFVSDGGKRCGECARLEFDHVEPVAQGGRTTTGNLRLRCRAHNQYAADCAFGVGFMHEKRKSARAKGQNRPEAMAEPASPTGFSAEAARRGVALCMRAVDCVT